MADATLYEITNEDREAMRAALTTVLEHEPHDPELPNDILDALDRAGYGLIAKKAFYDLVARYHELLDTIALVHRLTDEPVVAVEITPDA
jgi:hypothetical protein